MGSTFGEIGFLTRKKPTAKVIGSSTSIAPKVVGASRKAKAAAGEEDAAAERMGADRKRPQGKLYVIDGEALRRACAAHPKLLPALCTFTGRRIGEAMLAREKYFSAWSRSDIAAYLVRWETLNLSEATSGVNGTFCAGRVYKMSAGVLLMERPALLVNGTCVLMPYSGGANPGSLPSSPRSSPTKSAAAGGQGGQGTGMSANASALSPINALSPASASSSAGGAFGESS